MNLEKLFASLQGSKTYTLVVLAILYIGGSKLGLWELDPELLGLAGVCLAATLRAGINTASRKTTEDVAESAEMAVIRARVPGPGNGAMKLLAPLAIAALLFGGGCSTTMDPVGPYHGDEILFRADQSITTTYDVMNAFVKWEYDHRQVLAAYPEIRETADYVRTHAEQWIDTATIAREQYATFRSEQTRNALLDALAALRRSAATATSILELYGPNDGG